MDMKRQDNTVYQIIPQNDRKCDPTSVMVGDTAVLGTSDCYQDNTKSVKISTEQESYVIEPDTDKSAIVNFITNEYSLSNKQLTSSQERWSIDEVGNSTFVSNSLTDYTTSPITVITVSRK